jgi:hypothetical protein
MPVGRWKRYRGYARNGSFEVKVSIYSRFLYHDTHQNCTPAMNSVLAPRPVRKEDPIWYSYVFKTVFHDQLRTYIRINRSTRGSCHHQRQAAARDRYKSEGGKVVHRHKPNVGDVWLWGSLHARGPVNVLVGFAADQFMTLPAKFRSLVPSSKEDVGKRFA